VRSPKELPELLEGGLGGLDADVAATKELLGVQLPHGAMPLDLRVQNRMV